jgi:succinate dehydrogenase hydrophobic anchor subunit
MITNILNIQIVSATICLLLAGWLIIYLCFENQNTDYNSNNKWYNRISIRQIYGIINIIILVGEISYFIGLTSK